MIIIYDNLTYIKSLDLAYMSSGKVVLKGRLSLSREIKKIHIHLYVIATKYL